MTSVFAANIEDGEFLCPLCKQLSTTVVARDGWRSCPTFGNSVATEKLLKSDDTNEVPEDGASVGVFTLPIGHAVIGCIQYFDCRSFDMASDCCMAVWTTLSNQERLIMNVGSGDSIQPWDYVDEEDDEPTRTGTGLRLLKAAAHCFRIRDQTIRKTTL